MMKIHNNMKKYILALLAVVAVALGAAAQQTVKWRTSVRMTSPTEGTVTIRAIIPEGAHLYGMKMPEGGPKATTFDFSSSKGVKLHGEVSAAPAPVTARDEAFGCDLQWWTSRVAFAQRFTLTDTKDARIGIKITYMTCNGANCTPPRTETISAPVPAFKP